MTEDATPDVTLDAAIGALYSVPLEDFIRSRDALAREQRTAGNRAAADDVKALRKPARAAWALNVAVGRTPEQGSALDDAVADAVAAHAGGGDVRAAMTALRAAVRELAEAASEAAARAGHTMPANALSTAILAVLGSSESYAHLRRGRLADIPEGGGLDALSSLPAPTSSAPRTVTNPAHPSRQQHDAESLRAEVARAAERVAVARSKADAAADVAHDAKADLAASEQRRREIERELEAAIKRHENAQREAAAAAAELRAAQAAHEQAVQAAR
jgi:hypothetical protein